MFVKEPGDRAPSMELSNEVYLGFHAEVVQLLDILDSLFCWQVGVLPTTPVLLAFVLDFKPAHCVCRDHNHAPAWLIGFQVWNSAVILCDNLGFRPGNLNWSPLPLSCCDFTVPSSPIGIGVSGNPVNVQWEEVVIVNFVLALSF